MDQQYGSPARDSGDSAAQPALGFWIARQPIFNHRQQLAAYELLFRGLTNAPAANITDGTRATAQVIVQGAMSADIQTISGGHPMFVNFTRNLLVGDTALALDPDAYVIEVLEEVPPTPDVIDACRRLLAAGYRVALDDVVDTRRVEAFQGAASIVKVDWAQTPDRDLGAIVAAVRDQQMQLLAEKIEHEDGLRRALDLGCDYLQGYYLGRPESLRRTALPSIQPAHIRLLQAVSRPELDLDEVASALEADPALTYRLLRTVNSAAHALNRRVNSIREIVLYLGQNEIRRIATLVVLGAVTGNHQHLLLEAVARARFCDTLASELGQATDQQFHFYLTGLLSGLDGLLGCSMSEALAPLPLASEVTDALVDHRGLAADTLTLASSYLRGDWPQVELTSADLGIDLRRLNGIHHQVIQYAEVAVAA